MAENLSFISNNNWLNNLYTCNYYQLDNLLFLVQKLDVVAILFYFITKLISVCFESNIE